MSAERTEPAYSVVVPVYESHRSVVELVERLRAVFEEQLDEPWEVILVDDGSSNAETWPTCRQLAAASEQVAAIRLMRNYGKPAAVLCGLERVRGRYVITIDDDLQQRPEDIPALIRHQEHDVVVASFSGRHHSLFARAASRIKSLFDRVILRLPCRMSPLKLFRAEVARAMLDVRTPHPFIPALLASVTRDFVSVPLPHQASRHGRSRYTLSRRWRQFSNLLISNSTMLLRGIGVVGFVVALGGFGFALSVILRALSGNPPLPGWASLVVINLVFGGLVLIAFGIVGEYLIRILEGVSGKPPYVVRETVRSGAAEGGGQPATPPDAAAAAGETREPG